MGLRDVAVIGLGFIGPQDVGARTGEEKNRDGEEVGERGSLVQQGISSP